MIKPIVAIMALGMIGCATVDTPPSPVLDGVTPSAPASEPSPPSRVPDGSLADLLAAEIALRQGDFGEGYPRLLRQARKTGDLELIKRAARVGAQLSPAQGLDAAELYIAASPDNLEAQALMAKSLLETGQIDSALGYLISAESLGTSTLLTITLPILQANPDRAAELSRALDALPDKDRSLTLGSLHIYALEIGVGDPEAATLAESLLTRFPDNTQLRVETARLQDQSGQPERALQILRQGVSQDRENRRLLQALGQLEVSEDRFDDAINTFKKLVEQVEEPAPFVLTLGMLAIEQNQLELASEQAERLSQEFDQTDDARFIQGLVALRQDDLASAENLLRQVRGERFLSARFELGQALAEQAQWLRFARWFAEARSMSPENAASLYLTEVDLLREAGETTQISPLLERGVREFPNNLELRYARGLNILEQDFDGAIAEFESIIALDPDNASALNALGYSFADANVRLEEALDLIGRALSLRPDDPAIMDSMGWVHYRLGEYGQALDWLSRAYARLPDAEIATHLAKTQYALGLKSQARLTLTEALAAEPDSAVLQNTLRELFP